VVAAIMTDVSASHVTGEENFVGIVWTDGDVKHCSATTWTYDALGLCLK
jgi:hypothetical protein